jgi:hypothetical protein
VHPCTTCTATRAAMLSERAYDERDVGKSGVGVYEVGKARASDCLLRTNDEHRGINLGEQLFRDRTDDPPFQRLAM